MSVTRRQFLSALSAAGAAGALAACGARQTEPTQATTDAATQAATEKVDLAEFKSLAVDMKAWHYDASHGVWWQVGLAYCAKPASTTYEKLAIYVPGAYLKPTDENVDLSKAKDTSTYACEVDEEGTVGQFTAATAPIALPINAQDYTAQAAATGYLYDGLEPYLAAGMVYVYAGCRGRANGYESTNTGDGFFSGGAPWAVTDLKAAVRYLRYNAKVLPGSTDRIVVFGHAAGGLLASVMGTSGASELFKPYLTKIGAATHDAEGTFFGDEVAAVACWCPEAAAASSDAAYEWELGQFDASGTRAEGTWTRLLSNDLAVTWAGRVNELSLHGDDGTTLTLDETDGGIYTDGPYYEHLVGLVESSAASFLSKATFPHTFAAGVAVEAFPGSGVSADASVVPATPTSAPAQGASSVAGAAGATGSQAEVTFASRGDYVSALNAEGHWLTYNESKGTVRIAGLTSFVHARRMPTLGVCAFDSTERSSATNQLFGNDDQDSLHFSAEISDLLTQHSDTYAQASDWNASLPGDWAGDLKKTDSLDQPMDVRRNMYDPLYYVGGSSEGFGSAKVATHWRINVGMGQTTAPLTTGVNLALALKSYDGVGDVAFTPVWDKGDTLAEEGDADAAGALLSWVGSVFPAQQ